MIGSRLRGHRECVGLRQRALDRRAGVPRSSAAFFENDRFRPSMSSLKCLLDTMGISLSQFFSDDALQESDTVLRSAEIPQTRKRWHILQTGRPQSASAQ